jgi:hypothetical protein
MLQPKSQPLRYDGPWPDVRLDTGGGHELLFHVYDANGTIIARVKDKPLAHLIAHTPMLIDALRRIALGPFPRDRTTRALGSLDMVNVAEGAISQAVLSV